ncbi:uncharacterized protein B0I36DRAFT_312686, partial [Microdochium trichocladiopsis]
MCQRPLARKGGGSLPLPVRVGGRLSVQSPRMSCQDRTFSFCLGCRKLQEYNGIEECAWEWETRYPLGRERLIGGRGPLRTKESGCRASCLCVSAHCGIRSVGAAGCQLGSRVWDSGAWPVSLRRPVRCHAGGFLWLISDFGPNVHTVWDPGQSLGPMCTGSNGQC